MIRSVLACTAVALVLCGPIAASAQPANGSAAPPPLPAGTYKLDKAHASLVFHISHMGFSNFTSRFTKFDATLDLDPRNPAAASVSATVDPGSIEIYYSTLGTQLQGPQWFDVPKFPQMTFHSTHVELTGPDTARIAGDFSLHGVTQPVTLDAKFNGGYAANPYDPLGARVGFSAHGTLKRSAFGIAYGLPPPGTNMGVGDDVSFDIEAEFSLPSAKQK